MLCPGKRGWSRPAISGRQIGGVEPDDRRRHLAERDPESSAVRAERHVVGAHADVEAADDPLPREVEHGEISCSPVRDVGESVSGCDSCDLRVAEAAEDLDRPQAVPGQQRHGAGRGAQDEGRSVLRSGDHQRIDEMDEPQHLPAVRPERDGEHLVRGLGRDEPDRPLGRGARRRGRDDEKCESEERELAHAPDTRRAVRAVPVSYGVAVGGA
jgi:hypothetical protein